MVFSRMAKGKSRITLRELQDKINAILEETPEWGDVDRIGIVDSTGEDGFKEMTWLKDFQEICCDGQGMVAFELVME